MEVANNMFKEAKNGPDIISALLDVQLGASTMLEECRLCLRTSQISWTRIKAPPASHLA